MFRHSTEPIRKPRIAKSTGPRRLLLEPLESRTLLSAVPFTPTAADMGPAPAYWQPPLPDLGRSAQHETVAAATQQPLPATSNGLEHLSPLARPQEAVLDPQHSPVPSLDLPGKLDVAAPILPVPRHLTAGRSDDAALDQPVSETLSLEAEPFGTSPFPLTDQRPHQFDGGGGIGAPQTKSSAHDLEALAASQAAPAWELSSLNHLNVDRHIPPPSSGMYEPPGGMRSPSEDYFNRDGWRDSFSARPGLIELGTLGYELSQVSTYESLSEEGGLTAPAACSLLNLMDTLFGDSLWTNTTGNVWTGGADASSQTSETILSTRLARDGETGDSGLRDWSEDGLIDISGATPALSDGISTPAHLSMRTPLGETDLWEGHDLLSRPLDWTAEAVEAVFSESGEQRRDRDSRRDQKPAEAESIPNPTCEPGKGGMIELTTVPMTADAVCQAGQTPVSIEEADRDGVRSIPIDRGLGLYRAFELATSLGQPSEASGSVAHQHNAAHPHADSALSAAVPAAPAAEASAAGAATQPVQADHHAAAAPAVVVVSLASTIADAWRERRRRQEDASRG